ncbi:hypothetical protein M409DRAFT_62325 [Zasmidium cellare ATCC 36951]|uniref:Mitochondrial carrier n=1 Tax=Zasmidium cellare ATCC 36951 TaxID=1080233 RepID=A0A6A6D706_ZASCE|nr:uncharacterized protein M409DRAFT_62325 [Zasmidium cellare ATCC 36951]KAF2174228.1 hypothetical protein M409DRAFT_62325 [Zasmidium cellare ATCC 36951]
MEKRKPSTATSIIAGSIAGASETLVTYPFEYIKTRRQFPSTKNLSSYAIVRSTISTSGLCGLYSGCAVLAASNAAKSGIRFFAFESARSNLSSFFPSLAAHGMLNVTAGLCAGIAESVLVVTPGEAVKTRIVNAAASTATKTQVSTTQVIREMLRQNGLVSFWRGLGPVLCKQGTNSAVRFSTFGAFKDLLNRSDTVRTYAGQSVVTFTAGAGSGVVTVYASMPFDNIKTRLQMQSAGNEGLFSCARRMLLQEGIAVFWKATTPRLARLTLSSSITFTVYDYVIRATRSMA